MAPRLNLSFGLIIAVFLPGAVLTVNVALAVYPAPASTTPPPTPLDILGRLWGAAGGAAVVSLSLFSLPAIVAGLVLDATRYVITWMAAPVRRLLFNQLTPYTVEAIGKDDTAVFDWITDNLLRFHQAFANLALASLPALWILDGASWRWALIATVILLIAAIGTYLDTCRALNERFPKRSPKNERSEESR